MTEQFRGTVVQSSPDRQLVLDDGDRVAYLTGVSEVYDLGAVLTVEGSVENTNGERMLFDVEEVAGVERADPVDKHDQSAPDPEVIDTKRHQCPNPECEYEGEGEVWYDTRTESYAWKCPEPYCGAHAPLSDRWRLPAEDATRPAPSPADNDSKPLGRRPWMDPDTDDVPQRLE